MDFQYQLVTSSCLTWTVGWGCCLLRDSLTSHPHVRKGWKKQWKMQKVTIWSIDVFQSCNLLTYFHQAQWHRLYIRIWEHPQKKEKDSRKKNSHSEFKVTKYYLPQSSRSSCRSSGHLRLGDSDSFHKKLLWSSAGDWLFFFQGKI